MDDRLRVLLIEDDEDDYILVRDLLHEITSARYDLEWIDRAESVIEEMSGNRHDVYLMDYRLGQQNGLKLAQEAKAAGCRGPIIFLTGFADYEVDMEAMRTGAADYLVKDQITPPLLERSIRYAVAHKRIETALQRERDKLTRLYEAMPEGILVINQNYGIEYINPALRRDFGPVGEQTCHEYLYGRTEICTLCVASTVHEGNKVKKEYPVDKIGKTFDIICTPMHNADGTISVLYLFHDITERKQAEKRLKESEQQLRQISSRLLSAQEDERKRIAGDIHDIIGSGLVAIKFKLERELARKDQPPQDRTESLSALSPMLQEIIEESRRMQQDLRPSLLDDLGLLAALSWFIRRFQTIYEGMTIELDQGLEEGDIPGPLKIIIFRVMQEAMNNLAKHSQADQVRLSLQKSAGRLAFVLQDNGHGFNLDKVLKRVGSDKGLGLSSMRERVELSGGSLLIRSAEGQGTLIQASWALD
jgi:signal transduction histidine kinase